jgi:hypothetical protein
MQEKRCILFSYLLPLHVDNAVLAPVLEAVHVGGHAL